MSDLIQRLRSRHDLGLHPILAETAEEIEAQRELLRLCRAERDELAEKWYGLRAAAQQARAALSHMGWPDSIAALRALDAALKETP